jgi:hypothetical protein
MTLDQALARLREYGWRLSRPGLERHAEAPGLFTEGF